MDFELKAILDKEIKRMGGANYVSSATRKDKEREYMDITFKKADGTFETTTLDFPIPKDGLNGMDGKKGDKGDKGDKGEKGDKGSGGGTSIHNELEEMQGGMSGGKGEFYHLNKKSYDVTNKLTDDKAIETSRVYAKDAENNIANLVSVSDFETLYGNRLVGNTQFSSFRNNLRHVYNDGNVSEARPIIPSEVIPSGEYTQTINVSGKKGASIEGYYVTKVQIEVESKCTTPQVGRIELTDETGSKTLFENCKKGNSIILVDNFGNSLNKLLFDLPKPISVQRFGKVVCNFKIEGDSKILGSENQPSISLRIEELQDKQIADIDNIYELVPNAISAEDIFTFNVRNPETFECYINNINMPEKLQSPYGNLVVPEAFKDNKVVGIGCNVVGNFNTFTANSIRWMEFDDTSDPNFFFSGLANLESIYLPNLEDVQHERFIRDCPKLKELYVPKLSCFAVNSKEFIVDCPELVVYTSVSNGTMIDFCIDNKIKYKFIDIPTNTTPPKEGEKFFLGLIDNKFPEWMPAQDSTAIHKFADRTKDFHTFFGEYDSGVYRCFEMMDNIPEGYFAGDNDFYAFVYAVSEKYKTVEILDIRSGRRFTKCMLAGKWQEWIEWNNINQGSKVPVIKWNSVTETGKRLNMKLSDVGLFNTDLLWISCGSRGIAVKEDNIDYLEDYSSSYNIEGDNLTLWISSDGQNPRSNFEIYRFETSPITPPRGGCPYITLGDVIGDVKQTTKKGERFDLDVKIKSIELMRNLKITIETWGWWETVNAIFDGKAKYYFEFPRDLTESWDIGSPVEYTLSWQDQNGMNYTGFETIEKAIMA